MKKLIMGAGLAVLAAGCVSVNKNTGDDANLRQWVIKDVVHETYAVEQQRVTAENNVNCLFGFICWGGYEGIADQSDVAGFGGEVVAKNGAYAKACDDANCDQLAAARYKVTTKDYFVFKQIKAEVCGNPLKVTGIEVLPNKTFQAPAPIMLGAGVGTASKLDAIKGAVGL